MLRPSIFSENLFDDFFGFDRPALGYHRGHTSDIMKTDVQEFDTGYELDISLPGYKKEDIQAELKDGYLTISAETSQDSDEKDEKTGRYIRRERYYGSCSRSFYVGRDVKQEDVKARFEDGVLKLTIPKMDAKKPEIEQKKLIAIEG
ncbi:MAG: Hsp20/alpha crystallin family protein [Lachnospiraceae bacterium]|nr:Hsp20/alpha crystallin family protein [Lachnospiraceae bacterium]